MKSLKTFCIGKKATNSQSIWLIRPASSDAYQFSRSDTALKAVKAPRSRTTGAFKTELPDTFASQTHYKRALKGLSQVKADYSVKNLRNQERKLTAQSMDALMKGLTKPISEILNAYKTTFRNLHPFEATVADLTVVARVKAGYPDLSTILSNLKTLRAATSRIGKDYASRGSNSVSAQEAKELLVEGMKELEELYELSAEATSFLDLVALQKDLKRIPVVELETPTVVLVGAPNVGKSSIVRVVSSGTPEVNDYPFTTRGVTIGHIVDEARDLRFQVMDTPGLLDRPVDDRNEMEKLTFASLAHLPTAVIFVIDPTGLSGEKSTLIAQLNVRNHLKERFPKRPWLDVVSKGDLEVSDEVRELLPEGYLPVSVKTGQNVETLRVEIENMLIDLEEMLEARAEAQRVRDKEKKELEEMEELAV
eukprot:CAMPEP_0119043496 /NCGR_PEP_ID=MMETSP1177-20130426/22762_1 /TAXON_ID=2985 /ORGANISM="Ochromonas sp, Strain CCMP1899" /LENGTH=421 /DNA_ID=CAMNT_0007011733 /DNA_START=130 /DNA_END=1395 /DNA_ORIENTATION=-